MCADLLGNKRVGTFNTFINEVYYKLHNVGLTSTMFGVYATCKTYFVANRFDRFFSSFGNRKKRLSCLDNDSG